MKVIGGMTTSSLVLPITFGTVGFHAHVVGNGHQGKWNSGDSTMREVRTSGFEESQGWTDVKWGK